MIKLIEGVRLFRSNVVSARPEFFARLSRGQHPLGLFITCGDSRINPAQMTQTDPGELFVVRNAGNIVPPYGAIHGGEAASVEYAVAVLEVADVIVCGHTHCGAMARLMGPHGDALPSVDEFLEHAQTTRHIVKRRHPELTGADQAEAAARVNVTVQLQALRTHPSVAARVATGQLTLHGWLYRIETGEVLAHDPARDEFRPLHEVYPPGASLEVLAGGEAA